MVGHMSARMQPANVPAASIDRNHHDPLLRPLPNHGRSVAFRRAGIVPVRSSMLFHAKSRFKWMLYVLPGGEAVAVCSPDHVFAPENVFQLDHRIGAPVNPDTVRAWT